MKTLRGHAAYLRLYNQWRSSNEPVGAIQFEPEPKKVTEALEAITRYVLEQLNAKLAAKKKGDRP
jgi:hypothetical protein